MAAAAAITFVTGLWKGWFGARRDIRDDKKNSVINGTYEQVIASLKAALADARAEAERERALRITFMQEAEQREKALFERIRALEARCDALTPAKG